jgi:hypothetical protein
MQRQGQVMAKHAVHDGRATVGGNQARVELGVDMGVKILWALEQHYGGDAAVLSSTCPQTAWPKCLAVATSASTTCLTTH